MWEITLVPVRILKHLTSDKYEYWTGPTKTITLPIERVIPVAQLMGYLGMMVINIKESGRNKGIKR